MILDLFLISFIWVMILDVSGFMTQFKGFLGRIFKMSPVLAQNLSLKPIDCSLCMTWWTGLIYLLITHNLSLFYVAITLVFAILTQSTKDLIFLVQDLITWLFTRISKLLQL